MMPVARSVVLAKVRAKYLRRETVLPVLMRPGETRTLFNAADRHFINPGAVATIITIITLIIIITSPSIFLLSYHRCKLYYILIKFDYHFCPDVSSCLISIAMRE